MPHSLHVLPTLRVAGWQPTGFGGCITFMVCQLLGLQVGNLQGFRAAGWQPTGFGGCSTCMFCQLLGCRLATYGFWRLHYLRVLPAFRAAGRQPTGFGGCITFMFCQLLGLQVGNLQGLEAAMLFLPTFRL